MSPHYGRPRRDVGPGELLSERQTYLDRGNAHLENGDVAATVLEYRNAIEKAPCSPRRA